MKSCNMIKKTNLLYLLAVFLFSINTYAQTSGIGDVTSIELKAKNYEENKLRIAQHRNELIPLEALWRANIKKLKDELAALYIERDNLIADMKVGAKCSQCGKYKSEFEKEGKSFVQHLGEVKGYAIPATTTELEATRKMFTEKIALKKVQIQSLEKGDNLVLRKQNEISNLEKLNDNLCKEITAHSKNYETKVFSEATAKHDNWVSDLTTHATNILITDDKVAIYKDRIVRYEHEFQKESERIKERVKNENSEAQNHKNNKISINLQLIKEIETEQTTYVTESDVKMNALKVKKNETEDELKNLSLSEDNKKTLNARLNELIEQITVSEKKILDYKANIKNKITALNGENTKLKDEVFQLNANLSKQQASEIAKIKPIYDQKKLEASQSATSSTNMLSNVKKLYAEKAEYYKKQNLLYVDLVISESNRMIIAAQKITCPIWNEARFQVMGNWNKVFPCVNALTSMAKPYSTNVFNSYCPGKSLVSYMGSYKSFLIGLSEDDKKAVKGNTNSNWFDLITK